MKLNLIIITLLLLGCDSKQKIKLETNKLKPSKEAIEIKNKLNNYIKLQELNGETNYLLKAYIQNYDTFISDIDWTNERLEWNLNRFENDIIKSLNEEHLPRIKLNNKNIIRCISLAHNEHKCVTIIEENKEYKCVTRYFEIESCNGRECIVLKNTNIKKITQEEFDRVFRQLEDAYFWDITRNVHQLPGCSGPRYYIEALLTDPSYFEFPRYHKVKKDHPRNNSFLKACRTILDL